MILGTLMQSFLDGMNRANANAQQAELDRQFAEQQRLLEEQRARAARLLQANRQRGLWDGQDRVSSASLSGVLSVRPQATAFFGIDPNPSSSALRGILADQPQGDPNVVDLRGIENPAPLLLRSVPGPTPGVPNVTPPVMGAEEFGQRLAGTRDQDQEHPLSAPLTSDQTDRSAYRYAQVINQFRVGTSARYARQGDKTYCNVFARDVGGAMGAELPAFMTAAQTRVWLNGGRVPPINNAQVRAWGPDGIAATDGPPPGWHPVVGGDAARVWANQGRFTIGIAPGHLTPSIGTTPGHVTPGHVVVVRPGISHRTQPDGFDDGPPIAQAGGQHYDETYMFWHPARPGHPAQPGAFRPERAGDIQYWYHD